MGSWNRYQKQKAQVAQAQRQNQVIRTVKLSCGHTIKVKLSRNNLESDIAFLTTKGTCINCWCPP